jgi:hypothetical protein
MQYLKYAECHSLHGVDLSLADGETIELELGAEDLLEGPLRVVVGVVLEEGFLARWGEAESFRHSGVALQERASGQATSHPLDGHHCAFLGHERGWPTLLLVVSRDSLKSMHPNILKIISSENSSLENPQNASIQNILLALELEPKMHSMNAGN